MMTHYITEFTKNFIEINIDLIEARDWEAVVDIWYDSANRDFSYDFDDHDFYSFITVLNEIGIDFIAEAKTQRTEYIIRKLKEALKRLIDISNQLNSKEIKKSDVIRGGLATRLGFSEEELEILMDDLAENKFGLGVDFTVYGIPSI